MKVFILVSITSFFFSMPTVGMPIPQDAVPGTAPVDKGTGDSLPLELQLRNGARLEEKGDLVGALSLYRDLEKRLPGEERVIRSIGRVLFRMGKLDEAERLYLRERAVRGDTLLYGRELEAVHRTQRRFGVAILDIAIVLKNDPMSYDWARSELIAISKERDTLPVIIGELGRYREDEKSGGLMSSLLAEMHLRAGKDSLALLEAIRSDEKSGNDGGRLFQFASLAKALGRSETALLALGEVEKKFPEKPISVLASVLALEITLNLEKKEEAMKRLNSLALSDAVPYLSREAKKRLARLYIESLSDYSNSSYILSRLLQESDKERPELLILLARCELGMGEFERADSILTEVVASYEFSSQRDEALFRKASISLYIGSFDEAVKRYFSIAEELPGTAYANDGLEMAMFIDENKENFTDLNKYGRALLLNEIGKKDSSIVLLESMVNEAPRGSLEAHALLELGSLLEEKGDDEHAFQVFLRLGEEEPGNRLSPFGLKKAGEMKERILDFRTAASLYEKAILKYPDSFVVPELREKLGEIRKKVRS